MVLQCIITDTLRNLVFSLSATMKVNDFATDSNGISFGLRQESDMYIDYNDTANTLGDYVSVTTICKYK